MIELIILLKSSGSHRMQLTIRPALAGDEDFLWVMLYYAARMDQDAAASLYAAKDDPYLAKYVRGWGQPTDLGVVGCVDATPVGAVWSRLLVGEHKTYGYVDERTPEIAAAVLPEYIGRGMGTLLLSAYLERARALFPAVALNVRADNPALRLYKRMGFKVIDEIVNRVGTRSYNMLMTFHHDD
jgi:ribosomal protein S18 acetylase RimI-like enzyme